MDYPNNKKPLHALSRLKEAYLLWHKMAEHYEDPEEFRIYLNATIQALRNVTFILQKQKSEISNFDDWYKNWQDALKANPIMTWCVEARNKIVKEGDLRTYSIARASYVASYNDVPKNDFIVDPIKCTDDIAIQIANTKLPEQLKQTGYLKVERRWIVDDLQEFELLDALAYAFAVLVDLVMDVEEQHGPLFKALNESGENNIERGVKSLGIDYNLLPPSMASFADYRTVWVKLFTMGLCRYVSQISKFKPIPKEKIMDRYGKVELSPESIEGKSKLEQMAMLFLEQAKKMLKVDGYLLPVIFMLDKSDHYLVSRLEFPTHEDKYAVSQKLADEVEKRHIKAVIFISEAWMAPFAPKYPERRAEDSPERSEAIQLIAAVKDGEEFTFTVPFYRKDENIECGDSLPGEKGVMNFLEPIKKVWNKQGHSKSKIPYRHTLESRKLSTIVTAINNLT